MKKQTALILIFAVAFVILIGAAYVLYDIVGDHIRSDQINVIDTGPLDTVSDEVSVTDAQTDSVDYTAPNFTVADIDGNAVSLTDYFGKPIVLNFWASWCPPCKSEMPHFDSAAAEYNGEITFLMVNMTDGSRETVEVAAAYIAEQGYTFPVLYDIDTDAAMTYSVYSLPTTYFIDSAGNLIANAVGAIDAETLQIGIDMIYPESELTKGQ